MSPFWWLTASDDEAFDRAREMLGPAQVDCQLRQAIGLCWMSLPADKRNVEELERLVRGLVDRTLRDARSDDDSFHRMCEMLGPERIDQQIRNVFQFCWLSLPKDRRNVEELGRQIRRLMDRALRDIREDFDELFRR